MDIIEEIQEVENFLPPLLKREVYAKFFDDTEKWSIFLNRTYHKNTSYYNNWMKDHPIVENETFIKTIEKAEDNINYSALLGNIKHITEKKFNVVVDKILKVRFVYVPLKINKCDESYGFPHIDRDEEHHTLLYYICDNDAETIFFNQKFVDNDSIDYTNNHIIKRILPKENKAVLFNGLIYHSGNISKTSSRLTLNINLKIRKPQIS